MSYLNTVQQQARYELENRIDEPEKFPVIDRLLTGRVCQIIKYPHLNSVEFIDGCDECFAVTLTKDELIKLAEELKQVASLL